MDENIVTLFHGTTDEAANEIYKEKNFKKSNKNDDWLGRGIYFYNNINNAILYNIRKYKNNNHIYPTYKELSDSRKILVVNVKYNEDTIIDFNEINNLRKLLGLWKIFIDRFKDCEEYAKLKFKDGFVINWMFDNTDFFEGCQIIKNIFDLDLRFNRKIDELFDRKTRIGYNLNQEFFCIINEECIENINIYNENYEDNYEIIKDFTNNILMGG